MKVYELLKTNRWALEVMKSASIDGNDLKHVSMIEEYLKLKEEGHKTTFITTYIGDLCDKEIKFLTLDLAQPGAAKQLFDYCNENNINVDLLVKNAGVFFFN